LKHKSLIILTFLVFVVNLNSMMDPKSKKLILKLSPDTKIRIIPIPQSEDEIDKQHVRDLLKIEKPMMQPYNVHYLKTTNNQLRCLENSRSCPVCSFSKLKK
jgi:hypothetical protein